MKNIVIKGQKNIYFKILGSYILTMLMAYPLHAAPARITPTDLLQMKVSGEKDLIVVDLRSPKEFIEGHINGSRNILLANLSKAELPNKAKIVLYCSANTCDLSENAARELENLSYKNILILDGGIEAWTKMGFPLTKGSSNTKTSAPPKTISVKEVHKNIANDDFLIIDVRPANQFSAGHLPGAFNVPLENLEQRMNEISLNKQIVVYDKTSSRSQNAARMIAGSKREVREMLGGMMAWIKSKYPLEVK